jgi:mono/diheme cytochrome c family protein
MTRLFALIAARGFSCAQPALSVLCFPAFLWLSSCASASALKPQSIKLQSIDASETQVIQVEYDPVYQSAKQYRGMPLLKYFSRHGVLLPQGMTNTTVVFLCSDGYRATANLERLAHDDAFLVTSDLDAPPGHNWVPFTSHGAQTDPGPFYLVWPHVPQGDSSHVWPYAIESILIGTTSGMFARAEPKSDRFAKGFNLFVQNCMPCHSINGVGGTVGIELNVPRNVFEYWQPELLPAYVAHPENFRRNSKMPSFSHLGTPAIADILAYVGYMKDHKSEPSADK